MRVCTPMLDEGVPVIAQRQERFSPLKKSEENHDFRSFSHSGRTTALSRFTTRPPENFSFPEVFLRGAHRHKSFAIKRLEKPLASEKKICCLNSHVTLKSPS
ncbi:MAG: hypothetical protein REI09_08545 [Candidatus Dactylopiibacterium sp.]|nr:hypothetical protein [Candidatus Dactylopiibacterium sp.]